MQFVSNIITLSQWLCFLIVGLLANSVSAQNITSQELWKGVIIDSSNETAYLINPKSGIDSISIQTGLLLWHSDKASRPLLTNDSKLIAQSDSLKPGEISLIDLEKDTGKMDQAYIITVPNNVHAKVGYGLNKQFDITINSDTPKGQTLQWHYKDQAIQGMLPKNQLEPSFTYGEISLEAGLSLSSAKTKVLTQKPQKNKANIEGQFIDNMNGRQFKSIDGKHILVSTLKKNVSLWNKYKWTIFDRDGNLLGTLDNSVSYSAFIVNGGNLLFVSMPYARYKKNKTIRAPLALNAYSLTSNQSLWTKEIRDFSFQGVYPH